eukprot:jgi/Tetstr1/426566/TSEL_001642.t1
MYRKQRDVRNYLARYYFQDEGKDGQGGRKKGPLPSADGLAKALDLAEAWHQSELGRYYQAGKCPPATVMFKGEEEVCEVTPHWEAAVPTFGGNKPIVSSVQRNKIVSVPLAGTAASPKLHGFVGVLAHQQKRAGGIIKHNTNAVKNLAATQAVPGDNVDEGSSPEPPAKQPAKLAVGGLTQGRGGAGARAGGGALGSRAGRRAAVAAAATREQQAGRRGVRGSLIRFGETGAAEREAGAMMAATASMHDPARPAFRSDRSTVRAGFRRVCYIYPQTRTSLTPPRDRGSYPSAPASLPGAFPATARVVQKLRVGGINPAIMVWQTGKQGLMQHYYALGAISVGLAGVTLYMVGGRALRYVTWPQSATPKDQA